MRLKKEIVLMIIILLGIIILDFITLRVSSKTLEVINKDLTLVTTKIHEQVDRKEKNEDIFEEQKKIEKDIERLKNDWEKHENKLSLFGEHDELEKVTSCIIILEENFKNQEYETALENGAEFMYWLEHFNEKERLKLKNIF